MTNSIVKINNLHQTYRPESGEVKVLQGIDLKVLSGDRIAITGPSGSGKTTLLNLISGLDKPDSGEIFIEGQNMAELNPEEAEKFRIGRIGMIFQHHHLLPQCTALENVLLPCIPLKSDPAVAGKKAIELLEKMNMADRAEHFPSQLSGGEQLRVAIARALIIDPVILLGDEPTGFLDQQHGESIINILESISDRTLIVVTHADYVAKAMHKRYLLKDGKLNKAD